MWSLFVSNDNVDVVLDYCKKEEIQVVSTGEDESWELSFENIKDYEKVAAFINQMKK